MTRHLLSLYLYYGVYFIALGLTSYAPKYYGAIGLTNTQIGLISAAPAFIAIFVQPLWGVLSDRSRYKKNVIAAGIFAAALCAFAAQPLSGRFIPFLAALTLLSVFTLHAVPVGSAIALEYTREHGKPFGPIRLTGTVGYQLGILLVGLTLPENLSGLYPLYGALLALSCVIALLMPPVRGHQHGNKRVSIAALLRDRRILWLLGISFLAQMMAQFYLAFFSKYLGDIGMNNAVTGALTIISVVLEIPFLLVGDKLYKRFSIFKWLWIGLLLTAVRFIALSYAKTPLFIMLSLLPCVFIMISFEFYPSIYLSRTVSRELAGSAQNVYQTVTYGAARIAGALLGGMLAERIGIALVFRAGGFLLLFAAAVTFIPLCRKMTE